MTTYSHRDKILKMTTLLRGLHHPGVQLALGRHGFGQEDFEEGWRLLEAAMGRSFAFVKWVPTQNPLPEILAAVDRWENTYFDVADAVLRHRYPSIHAWMFHNLSKSSGVEVLLSVGTFVSRYEELAVRTDAESRNALELLRKRGLGNETIGEARSFLERARHVEAVSAPSDLEEKKRIMDAAVDAMWEWYQEWAQIARVAIANKRLRIHLGISSPSGSEKSGEASSAED